MADTKISALTAVPSASAADIFAVVQGGVTMRETLAQAQATVSATNIAATGSVSAAAAYFGDGTNLTKFESDGTVVFEGNATVWDDVRVPGLLTKIGASAPTLIAVSSSNLQVYAFDGAATLEQVFFTIQMPHSYKLGTTIHPHVHWAPTTASTGDVVWQLEYAMADINGTISSETLITATDAASTVAWQHQYADVGNLTSTFSDVSGIIMGRLYRDPSDGDDTFGNDAAFLEFDVHFEIDTVGSRAETSK